MINHTRLNPDENVVLLNSLVTGNALHGSNFEHITSKIRGYFGKESVKTILDVEFSFLLINRQSHWYAAVVVRPNLILKGDSGNSG